MCGHSGGIEGIRGVRHNMANIVTKRSRRTLLGAAFACLIASLALAVPAAAGTGPVTRWVDDDGEAGPGCSGDDFGSFRVSRGP